MKCEYVFRNFSSWEQMSLGNRASNARLKLKNRSAAVPIVDGESCSYKILEYSRTVRRLSKNNNKLPLRLIQRASSVSQDGFLLLAIV